jgi:hypothetical protein
MSRDLTDLSPAELEARALGGLRAAEATAPDRLSRLRAEQTRAALEIRLQDVLVLSQEIVEMTPTGNAWLELGIHAAQIGLRRGRRTLVRPCLDWSERRDHVAGAVGAAVTGTLLDRRWIVRMDGTRAVRLTARGQDGLHRALGLEVAQPAP